MALRCYDVVQLPYIDSVIIIRPISVTLNLIKEQVYDRCLILDDSTCLRFSILLP